MSTANDDMRDRFGQRSPTSGIIANAMHPEARIDSMSGPERVSVPRKRALPVTAEDVVFLRFLAGFCDVVDDDVTPALNDIADRIEAWIRTQEAA